MQSLDSAIRSNVESQIESLLSASETPEGVVFDIETMDPLALQKITPYLLEQVKRVKAAYPESHIAVVSHGVEEYALTSKANVEFSSMHSLLNKMVLEQEVSLHVCGAVAGLKGLEREDFPGFVSFSASGQAQLNDYKALDYVVIVVEVLKDHQRKQLFNQAK